MGFNGLSFLSVVESRNLFFKPSMQGGFLNARGRGIPLKQPSFVSHCGRNIDAELEEDRLSFVEDTV